MTLRDLALQALIVAAPFALIALGAPALRWLVAARQRTTDTRVLWVYDVLERFVRSAVAYAQQRVVGPAKDPGKPGTWDARKAAEVKAAVAAEVLRRVPARVTAAATALGLDVPATVDTLIEEAVLELKGRLALEMPAAGDSLRPPPLAPPPRTSPLRPPPPATRGEEITHDEFGGGETRIFGEGQPTPAESPSAKRRMP